MLGHTGYIPVPDDHTYGENRRRHGRVRIRPLRCCLGRVLDVSAGGICCLVKGKPLIPRNGVASVRLPAFGGTLVVGVRIAWSKRLGMLAHEVGFQFLEPNPTLSAAMRMLAECEGLSIDFD